MRRFCNKVCENGLRRHSRPYTDTELVKLYKTHTYREIADLYRLHPCVTWRDITRLVPKESRRTGNPRKGKYVKDKNPSWKGGSYITQTGYVMKLQPNHPNADIRGYVREHVFVA